MYYRTNLYREYYEKRRRARQGVYWLSLLAVVVGIEVVLIGSLGVSAVLLNERASRLEAQAQRLQARLQEEKAKPLPGLELATQAVALRSQRLDWSPKLAAMSKLFEKYRHLQLRELEGHAPKGRQPGVLELYGLIARESAQADVYALRESVEKDSIIGKDFPRVTLGSVQSGEFLVICRSAESGS